MEKSGFSVGQTLIYAGNSTTVTVSLVDSMLTAVNITNNTAALTNLTVVLLTPSQSYSPTSEYNR